MLNPEDPESAQRIVAEYAGVLERTFESGNWPATLDALPYPKQIIKAAIRTSCDALTSSGRLTADLREFLETAYVSLADYVSGDLVRLMSEYQNASTALAADPRLAREKTSSEAWHTVASTGTLAGTVARTIADEAELLRVEFRRMVE
jgi:hypothetical protein